jgi:beta-xylosidase
VSASITVRNTGERPGTEVVQLYLHDPVASVVRPVQRLVGFARVPLDAGESARVDVDLPLDLASFTGRDGRRVVEPGALELRFAASSADVRLTASVQVTGPVRVVGLDRALHPRVSVRGTGAAR